MANASLRSAAGEDWERLRQLLMRLSVRRSETEFVLASGRRSNIYVDARLTTCRAEAMPLIGRLFLARISERGWTPAAIGGLTLGADPIVVAVARESLDHGRPINAFLVRKETKKHGTQKRIEGLSESGPLDVVVVDDVCTTGDSTVMAIEASREAGLDVLGAICLVDREEGARENIEDRLGCPFDRIYRLGDL